VTLNGEPAEFASAATVDDVITSLGIERRGVAVSLDREVVPRSQWVTTPLHDGASVEVLAAAAGG
jgi:sulfur carrier protein